MDEQSLKKFLLESNKKGYASQDESSWMKEKDRSTTIRYVSGDWSFHDNYFGGEPYGGRQVIFFKGKPLWITVYYGQVDNVVKNIKDVYTFLKKALLHPRKNFPLRGQPEFKDGNYKYTSILRGDVRNFYLEEKIYKKNAEIYSAGFFGGFVDQRSEE